jgi:hypothetical protein
MYTLMGFELGSATRKADALPLRHQGGVVHLYHFIAYKMSFFRPFSFPLKKFDFVTWGQCYDQQ